MGVQVTFNYTEWVTGYPAFAAVPEPLVVGTVLPLAEVYLRNDGGGPVTTAAIQTALLNLIVAHVCQLLFGPTGGSPSGLVGRISSASEGSVSVSMDFPTTPSNAWFMQTSYGAAFWQATAQYRTMRYLPGPQRLNNPWPNQ